MLHQKKLGLTVYHDADLNQKWATTLGYFFFGPIISSGFTH